MFGILRTPRIRLRPEATMKRITVRLSPKRTWQTNPGDQMAERASTISLSKIATSFSPS
jgi:hypothetical protein